MEKLATNSRTGIFHKTRLIALKLAHASIASSTVPTLSSILKKILRHDLVFHTIALD